MQIFVKTLENKSIGINCSKETTIDQLKQMIEAKEGVPISNQRLIYQAKQLEGNSTLGECGIEALRTIHLLLRVPTAGPNPSSNNPSNTSATTSAAPIDMNSLASLFTSLSENKNKPLSLTPEQIQLMLSSQFVQQQQQLAAKNSSGSSRLPSPTSSSSTKMEESNVQQYFVDLDEQAQKSPTNTGISENNIMDSDEEMSSDEEFEEVSHTDSNGEVVKKKQKRGKRGCYTKRACSNCRMAHAACDAGRPCKRCVTLGKSDTCVDAQRKRTKKRPFTDMNAFTAEKENLLPSMTDYIPMLGQIPTANIPTASNSSLPPLKPLPMNPFATLFPPTFPFLNLNFGSLPLNTPNTTTNNTSSTKTPSNINFSVPVPLPSTAAKQPVKTEEIDEFESVASTEDHITKQIEQQLIDQNMDNLNLIDDPPSAIALDLSTTPQTPLSAITGSTEFGFNFPPSPTTPTSITGKSIASSGMELVPQNYFNNQVSANPEQLLSQFLANNSLATPQQNTTLIQHLLYAYSKQSQELNDLKELVKQLHQMVLTSSVANFALSSRLPNSSLPKIQ